MLHQTSPIDRDTIPADPVTSSRQAIAATARVVPSPLSSTSSSSSTTVRLWFPEGDSRRRLQNILANAPDPNLRIKKKSVRFEQNASLSPSLLNTESLALTSTSNDLRRDDGKIDCPVISSVAKAPVERKPPIKSSPSPPPSSTTTAGSTLSKVGSSRPLPVGYVYTNVPTAVPVVVDHKDPEEKLAELMDLKKLKVRQDDLFHLKDQIFQLNHNLEDKEGLLDEVRAERKSLQTELNRYVAMVKQIQKDYELTSQAEAQLIKERDELSQQLGQIRDHDYKALKEEVDLMRTKKGFRPLPSLEQEQAEVMGRYLEERRGQWRHGDLHQGGTTSAASPSLASFSNTQLQEALFPAEGSSSSSGAVAGGGNDSGSRSKSLRGSTSTSSFVSASSSSRGREGSSGHGRSGKSNSSSGSNAHVGHARSSSSSSNKSRHDTHSRRSGGGSSSGGGGRSSRSSHRGQSLSRSHSPAPQDTSQSSLREERQKKRARY